MGSEAVLDFDALLQPIQNGVAVGEDLRKDISATSPYFRLKTARSQASAAERGGASDPESAAQATALWRSIAELSLEVLRDKAKDLQVGAWLVEGLVRSKGFAGLRDGVRLLREMSERWWDEVHPLPDEDGIATRVAPIFGLNGDETEGTLIAPIAMVPIARAGEEVYATWHWLKATTPFQGTTEDEEGAARRAQYEAGVAELRSKMENAARTASPGSYDTLVADVDEALAEVAKLSDLLDSRCGSDAPPFGNIRKALQNALDAIRAIAGGQLSAAATAAEGAAGAAADGGGGGAAPAVSGELATREQAFAQLKRVADFFRRTEPHSPISYVVENAVRLGALTLPEMLMELIPDDAARDAYFKRTGIRPPAQSTS